METQYEPSAAGQQRSLRVRLVLIQKGWIFEKFATRMAENLPHWNVEVDIGPKACPEADFNHWMVYLDTLDHTDEDLAMRSTMFITHVDRPAKLTVLKTRMATTEMGFCMSRMTMDDLVARGLERKKLCYITAAHDGVMKPRRIVLGITSRLRPDGAKREDILLDAAREMPMDSFHFEIIGRGWEKVIPQLEAAGATVRYYPGTDDGKADYQTNIERVPQFDYYLYMGFDDGSMGFFDALAAGVPTIVTPQGYHLDVKDGITFPFKNAGELKGIFQQITAQRKARIQSVARLTWDNYAKGHALVWRAIWAGRTEDIPSLLAQHQEISSGVASEPLLTKQTKYEVKWAWNRNAMYMDVVYLLRNYLGYTKYKRLLRMIKTVTGRGKHA
jgi:hypothetical protein